MTPICEFWIWHGDLDRDKFIPLGIVVSMLVGVVLELVLHIFNL